MYKRDDRFLLVNNVPCEQCDFCGEQYFAAGVLKQIEGEFESIYESGKKVATEIRVPVEEFAEIPGGRG